MFQQPTSLLSLPDELLVQIFNYLAGRFSTRVSPTLPLTLVCRRVRKLAQAVLYHDVTLSPYSDATPLFGGAIMANPSLGQLVDTLTICGTGSEPDIDKGAAHKSALVQATIAAVSNLRELTLSDMTTEEASAILAAFPSTSLRNLHIRLWLWTTPVSSQWKDLWGRVARFSELRVLTCEDWRWDAELVPPATAHSGQHIPLAQLVKLEITDDILIKALEAAGPLRQVLPNLRELQITISRSEDSTVSTAVTARLSEAPPSLAVLKLVTSFYMPGTPRQYLPASPALRHLSHLELGAKAFTEDELLVYLSMAPLESITFYRCASVTDRILQALTGPARSPQLRRICLDHVFGIGQEEIRDSLKAYLSEGNAAEEVRRQLCPQWPPGGTEQGLRLALSDAKANGIQVTGSALACSDWDATFDKALADLLMERAHKTDDYGDVIARFGEEVAVAWLKEHAPHTVRLLHAHMSVLESDNRVP
ncbi:hypothetical protein JCM8115_006052 [Rhodotorula mucilaginosa]